MNLEQTRIRGDVFCPQVLHHFLHLMGAIIFAIREHVSKLPKIHASGVRGAGMGSIPRSGRLVGNTLRRNLKLVSLNRRRRHFALLLSLVARSPLTSSRRRGSMTYGATLGTPWTTQGSI